MEKFLEIYNLPKVNLEERENLNEATSSMEIKSVIKTLQMKKNSRSSGFTGKFYQIFNALMPILKVFKKEREKTDEEGKLSNSFYKTNITLIL